MKVNFEISLILLKDIFLRNENLCYKYYLFNEIQYRDIYLS